MTKTNPKTRLFTLLLAVLMLVCSLPMSASAATIADGSATATIAPVERYYYLHTTVGTALGASAYQYTTNDGVTGPGYCIDHGLGYASRPLPITGKYTVSPRTAGAFANGYPQQSVETFLERFSDDPVLEGLTEQEYKYATQLAVWATLGQLAIEGTAFTSGRETVGIPTGDAQQMRVFRAIQWILYSSEFWDTIFQTGMYIRLDENTLGGNISIPADMTLDYAAANQNYGIKREVINGKSYYTREYIFASATSTYYSDYNIEVWADNAPAAAIFTDTDNNELPRGEFSGKTTWRVPTERYDTTINSNGYEYSGAAKLCIPVDTAPNKGEITINSGAYVMQYDIYLAQNDIAYEQSYIIADPSKGTVTANAVLNWGSDQTEKGDLQVLKVNGSGQPLAGASFTLTGTDGSSRTGTTNNNGVVSWEQLDPSITYTLTETTAPAGYAIVDPVTVNIKAAQTNYVTVQDSTQKRLTIKKIDKQTGYSLAGAVIAFEQIDGDFYITRPTDQAGIIQLDADQLPVGSYKVYEITAPAGYELDSTAQTVNWTGRNDVTLTFNNVRTPTLVIYKCDADNIYSLPGATFEVYKNGQFVTSVTTNDNGLAYVPNVTTGYYTVKEIIAPAGYVLESKEYSVYIDNYNPATTDDPRITVYNSAMPMLRIVKYDAQTMQPLPGVTFAVYRDTELIGEYTTKENGEIFLYDLEPGTYTVQEIAAPGTHVVNSTPQSIKLEAGTQNYTLVFLNDVKPGIRMVKLDSQTMKPLANARFRVTEIGGTFSNEYTTDGNGEIDLTGLNPGSYTVEELAAPDGYLIDDSQRVIKIEAGENAVFVFTNTKNPSLTVIKFDAELSKKLSGAAFRVSKIEDGTHYLDRITDMDGEFTIENLEPGVYSVQEIDAPSGYVKNETEFHVELFPGQNSQLVVTNEAKPDLKIVKTDAVTGKPVQGVTFTVKKVDGSTITTEATDTKGEILIEDLDPGVYEITEQSVPDGYLLDPIPQKITLVPNKTGVVQFQNYPKPTLTIKKIDSATGKPVEGARFHVIYASNHTFTGEINDLGEHYTDADGLIHLDKLRDGWYQVTEVAAPDGYRIQGNGVQECYIAAGTDKVLVFENVPLSTILIQKMDAETGKPLPGAWFRLRYLNAMTSMDGTTLGEYVTDENGQIEITNLDEGTYIVEEISAPAGYVLSSETTRTVYLAGENQDFISIIYGNQKMGSLLIVKKDSLTGAPLSGVEFFVTDSDGSVVGNGNGKFTTDFAGSILISNLEPGKTIVAKETRTVSGYVLDDAPQTVKIKANETVTLEFRNAPKGTLIVQKIDSATGKPLTGAEFKITAANGELTANNEGLTSSNGLYRTDSNGQVVLEKLTPGTYVVTETKAPDGYELIAQPQTVVVNAGDTQTLVFENPPKGSLIVQKYDKVSGQPLPGAEFKITAANGELVADNEGLTSTNGIYVTDQNGQIILSKLNSATYVVTETKAPEGFQLDPTPQTVVVNANDTQTLNFYDEPLATLTIIKRDVDTKELLAGAAFSVKDGAGKPVGTEKQYVTGSDGTVTVTGLTPNSTVVVSEETPPAGYWNGSDLQTVVLQSGTANSVTFENRKLGTLIIRKFIEGTSNEPLKGVAFRVTASDGTEVGPDGGVYYTDAKGEIVLNDLQPDITVKAREIKTVDGFILDGTPQDVKIIGGQTQMLTFWNAREQTLTVQKYIEGTTTPIEGVVFLITDSSGAVLGTNNGEFTTDRNGRIVLTGLTPGTTVTAKEIKTVSGFVLDTTPQSILIKEGEAQTMTFYNERKGGLIIEKRDSITNAPLPGAEFRITTLDGAYVDDNEGQTSTKGVYRTDSNGQIVLSNLQPDSYVVREIKAPDGYVLVTEEQSVKVNTNDTQTITFLNEPLCSLTITKLDSVTGKPVPGTVFAVKDGNGNLIGNYTTGADGTVTVTGLIPGSTVVVSEIKVPDGYVLNPTPQTIVVGNTTTGSAATGNTMTFYDEPLSTLIIQKYVEGTTTPIKGARFLVTDGTGAAVGTTDGEYVTDAQGQIVLKDLEPGTVITAKEIKAADGYVLNSDPKSITIKSGDVQTITFYNSPAGTLIIVKRDRATDAALAGARFQIMDASGAFIGNDGGKQTSNGEFTSDDKGQIIITGLQPGSLVIREIKAPDGYMINEQPVTVKIEANDTQTINIYNDATQTLTVQKYVAGTTTPIDGVEFLITDSSGAVLGTNNGEFTTDRNGRIVLTGLTPGTTVTAKEIKTVSGFVLDSTPQSILIKEGEAQSLTFYNERKGNLIVEKRDSVTGQPLPGAEFRITTLDGAYVDDNEGQTSTKGIYRTDAYGQIVLSNLQPNSYVVREIKAPEGYVLVTEEQSVKVNANDTQTIAFLNEPLCSLTITKLDSVTGKPVPGTVFKVTDGNGNLIGNYTTGADGTVTVTGLIPGSTVVVSEVKVPDGYVLNPTPQTITVKNGANTVTNGGSASGSSTGTAGGSNGNGLTFEDDPTMNLTIHKYIEGTANEPLAGVAFKITDGSGTPVGPGDGVFYTDAAGEIVVEGLEPGTTVTAQEIKTVEGFVLDGTPKSVKISAGAKAPELIFWNKRAGTLVIQKKDSVTGALIAGAQFQLTYANGAYVDNDNGHLSSNGLYTTDAAGEIRISGITGTVVVKEIQAAPGYVISQSTQTQTVAVNPDETQTLTFLNEPLCTLTLTKVDSVTGKPVPGTEFTVKDSNGNVVGRYTTGQDGTVTVTGLIPGCTYVVTESKVPDGYVLNPTPQTITVTNGTGNSVSSGTSGGAGTSGNGGNNGLTFENDPTTTLIIEKYVTGTTTPLKGVTFLVTDSSGTVVGSSNGEYITDENGRIVIEDLEPGMTVTVKEIRTVEGYILDTAPKTIKIKTGEAQTLRFYNQPKGTLVIQKKDSVTGKPLAGVEFQLTYANGSYVDADNGHLSSNGLYSTDANGEIRISGVTGTIVVTETKTISGYIIDQATKTQTVKVNPEDTQTIVFYNTPIGGVELIKVNAAKTSERIPGVTFEIRRVDDALVDTVTTDKNGRVFVALDEGSYYAVEITAAEGYKLDATPTYFEVKAGKTTTKTITNEKYSGITIHKIDSVTGQGIYGVTFVLYDSGKTPIEQMTTDQYGYARTSSELKAGQYFLRELEAAEGYVADTQYKTVFVEAGKTTTIEWENTPITAQIQLTKYAAENNTVTGQAKGTTLQGAVYEIVRERSGVVVATITTDARGVAASPALPLGRYLVREVTAPAYWQLSEQTFDVTLEYPGQIIKLADYDKPAELGVTITKRGVAQALAGSTVKYDITVANTSNVPLESFFWHDRIPTDVATATTLTTGTYSARLNYRILYKTSYNQTWQVLASNLLTTNNYSFALNAIPVQYGEKVTDVYFDFGKVPVGFQSVTGATLSVIIAGDAANGYQMINRADAGGKYQETWQTANAGWVTGIMNLYPKATLPKTGY